MTNEQPPITAWYWRDGDFCCVIDWRDVRQNWTDNLYRWSVVWVNKENYPIELDTNVVSTLSEARQACIDWIARRRA